MSTQDLKLFDLLDGLEMTKSQYEWLARRFENMTAKEALLFRGAMQIEQPQATCDVMQIANQLEHYELLYGAGNDFALGNFVMEHMMMFTTSLQFPMSLWQSCKCLKSGNGGNHHDQRTHPHFRRS